MMFFQAFTLTQTFIVILLLFSVIFSTIKIAFTLGFDIIPVTLRFKSFVLFGMHTLLDGTLRVLQPRTNLSSLAENG